MSETKRRGTNHGKTNLEQGTRLPSVMTYSLGVLAGKCEVLHSF
jgi:hypothetical protein